MNSQPTSPPHPGFRGDAVRVLVANADADERQALRAALDEAGVSVVAQAADAQQVISLVNRCDPDVVLMDAALPPDGAIDAMRLLAATAPGTQVIVIERGGGGPADALHALSRGAVGYLTSDLDHSSLARAVEGVMTGEAAISRTTTRGLVDYVRDVTEGLAGLRPIRSPLTTREWEVLDALVAGAGTAEIANQLVVAPETVESHIQHILRKLGAHSRAEAVKMAAHARAVPPPLA